MTALLDWGVASDTGRVRERNEDRTLVRPPLFAIADGMGGHSAGEVASSLAVETLEQHAGGSTMDRDETCAAIARANQRILDAAGGARGADAMGTTLVGLLLEELSGVSHWLVFNVGDSRIYRWSDGRLTQVTVDHSEVQELVSRGQVRVDAARSHRLRNVITRSLGSEPMPEIDWWRFPVVTGERLLICSDGLPLELTGEQIDAALGQRLPAAGTATKLVEAAVAAGGRDNVSVIVVDVLADAQADIDEDTSPRERVIENSAETPLLISKVPV